MRRLALVLLALPLLLAAPPGARANMADPIQPGTPAGEPGAALAGLTVLHERLLLDLRPLATRPPEAAVEATYRVRNDGPARTVRLLFVPVGLAADEAAVWVDGRPLAVTTEVAALPDAWAPPDATPDPDGGAPLAYRAEAPRAEVLRFDAPVGPGAHEIRVRYRADAGTHDTADPTMRYQLGYVLAPARRWAGFGGLDVEVRVPDGWRAAAAIDGRPALDARGGRLTGHFDALPGDALAVTAHAPTPWAIWPIRVAGALAALALCLWAGRFVGRRLARSGRGSGWALPVSALAGVGAGVLVAVAWAVSYGLGDGRAYSYGGVFVSFLAAFPLATLLGTALAQGAAVRARRAHAPS